MALANLIILIVKHKKEKEKILMNLAALKVYAVRKNWKSELSYRDA